MKLLLWIGCLGALTSGVNSVTGAEVPPPTVKESTEERFIPNYSAGNLYYLYSTPSDFKSLSGADLSVNEAGILAPFPIRLRENSKLTAGVRFIWNGLDFSGPQPLSGRLDLYRLQIPINYWHSFGDKWKFWGMLQPGLFTDFRNLDTEAVGVSVLALASYQFTPKLSVAFGGYYSRDLGEDRLLPALGVIWRPNKHWNLGITYPRFGLSYAPTANWLFSLYAAPGGSGWSYYNDGIGENQRLNYTNWRGGFGAERRIIQREVFSIAMFLEGGWQFGQELEITQNGNTITDTDLEDSQFISAGFRLRF